MITTSCKFTTGVICSVHDKCDSCGWNPEVSAMRKEDIRYRIMLGKKYTQAPITEDMKKLRSKAIAEHLVEIGVLPRRTKDGRKILGEGYIIRWVE